MRFDLAGSDDRELPLILGLMPVLPKHAIDAETFEETTLEPTDRQRPLRRRARSMPARASRFKRDPNYWGRDLPINRGLWNFDEIRFDFYRDANAYFEAFKTGLYDVRTETDPGRWQTGYDFPAVRDGRVVKEAFPNGLPKASFGFVFNTRRPVFADIRVREAIALLFDFEWINHNFFFDLYQRSGELLRGLRAVGAIGRPADARERALLAPFPDAVRPDVLDGTWSPPVERRLRPRPRRRCGGRSRCFAPPATSSTARRCASARPAQPFSFEIMVTSKRRGAAGARLFAASSSAPASTPGARGRCRAISSSAARPSIST